MVRVVVEGEVSREPELLSDNGEIWWAVVSVDARPDYWGRPKKTQRTFYRIRSRSEDVTVELAIGDVVRIAGVLHLWGWYDRAGNYRYVAEVVGSDVELVDRGNGEERS